MHAKWLPKQTSIIGIKSIFDKLLEKSAVAESLTARF
jgi:hypothetical protein